MKYFKLASYVILAGLMVMLWPIIMLLKRFRSRWRTATASAQVKLAKKEETNEDLVVSARAQMLEVCIESSFQPLLQLYILLPTLLCQLENPKELLALVSLSEVFEKVERIQFWSVLTSVVSLSWSFSHYQSVQKKGALDFGSNPIGRMLLLLANLLQITSRLLALVLYAYQFGAGNFWPMILSVMIHICLMSLLHYKTSDEWKMDTFKGKPYKIGYHCLINGISNLYLHNRIVHINIASSELRKAQHKNVRRISRQLACDIILVVENGLILIKSYAQLHSFLPNGLLPFIAISQFLGILLKFIYYDKYHIWKNAFDYESSVQQVTNGMRATCFKIKSRKKLERQTSSRSLYSTKEEGTGMLDEKYTENEGDVSFEEP